MYFLFKMGIFHCYVCLREGRTCDMILFGWAGLGTVNIQTWKSSWPKTIPETPIFRARKKCNNGQKDAAKKTRKPFWHFRFFALTLHFRMFSSLHVFVFLSCCVFAFFCFWFCVFSLLGFRVFALLVVTFVLWDLINMNEVLPGKLRYITRRRGGRSMKKRSLFKVNKNEEYDGVHHKDLVKWENQP